MVPMHPALVGLLALGTVTIGAVALGRRGSRVTPTAELEIVVPLGDDPRDELGETWGEIVRDFEANPGNEGIDARMVTLGPLLPEIPTGTVLLVSFEMVVPSQPPAIPGAVASQCEAVGYDLEYGPALHERAAQRFVRDGCKQLRKPGGGDYDTAFPFFELVERPDGVHFRYRWIAFRHEQAGNVYTAKPHRVRLAWELV